MLFLALGMITNVAVAWSCAWRLPIRSEEHVVVPGDIELGLCGWRPRECTDTWKYTLRVMQRDCLGARSVSILELQECQGRIIVFSSGTTMERDRCIVERISAGIPCTAFEGEVWQDHDFPHARVAAPPTPAYRRFGLLPVVRTITFQDVEYRVASHLPFKPVWSGMIVNSMVYAMLCWLLLKAGSSLRRWRRTRGGLCPFCAYPFGRDEVCSECGGAVDQRLVPGAIPKG